MNGERARTTERYDAVVVGGGHNGLVCAAYLAKAGRRVLVLEAAEAVGGAAVTREIAPGFKVSACAHLLHLLHPRVVGDLDLERHGLRFSARDLPTAVLGGDGGSLILSSDAAASHASVARHSQRDAQRLAPFRARLRRIAGALRPWLEAVPPRLGSGERADALGLVKLAWPIRRLGRDDMRELLRIAPTNVADLVAEQFETPLLQAAFAFDAVLGARLGPRSPTSAFTLLYRLAAEGGNGGLAHPAGGMGALSEALARAARAAGAEIRTATPVARIEVRDQRASGVILESGERVAGGCVVSGADPRRTFLSLVGPEHLDTGFVRRVRNLRMRGITAKLNLALDARPTFAGLEPEALAGRLLIAPSVQALEAAFDAAKYGALPASPAVEITLPSVHDAGLAPSGKHVLSAVVQYAPYDLKEGWEQARERLAQRVIDAIAAHAPDLRETIRARQLITPADLEHDFRLTGGHWHHGELALDQFLMLRPVPGAAQYASPLPGLYLAGAGAHPGGGVTGAAGMNAARQVLAREPARS